LTEGAARIGSDAGYKLLLLLGRRIYLAGANESRHFFGVFIGIIEVDLCQLW
jgi:hypothetical protein